jgi:hypothetical protein
MAQEFSNPTRSQMPEISNPNSFGMEPLRELPIDGLNAVTAIGEGAWIGLSLVRRVALSLVCISN